MKNITDYISNEPEAQIVDEANVKSAEFSIETIAKVNRLPKGFNFLRYDPKTHEVQLINIVNGIVDDEDEYKKLIDALDVDDWHGEMKDQFTFADGIHNHRPGECYTDDNGRSWIVLLK